MDLGPHATFIVLAYAAAVAVLALLVIWIASDYRAQVRAIDSLEKKGVRRRSGTRSG